MTGFPSQWCSENRVLRQMPIANHESKCALNAQLEPDSWAMRLTAMSSASELLDAIIAFVVLQTSILPIAHPVVDMCGLAHLAESLSEMCTAQCYTGIDDWRLSCSGEAGAPRRPSSLPKPALPSSGLTYSGCPPAPATPPQRCPCHICLCMHLTSRCAAA